MDAREQGRADLVAWVAAQPDDLYADDHALQALTSAHSLAPYAERFHAAGSTVAGPLDRVVRENNLARNLPVLDDWSGVGEYTARVSHHPTWAEAGRLIYGTGIMGLYGEQPASHRAILTLFYLTAQAGEAGHNCPLACDAGAIRTLQALGTPSQQARYLAPRLQGSQRQGSAVRGLSGVARAARGDGEAEPARLGVARGDEDVQHRMEGRGEARPHHLLVN